MIKHFCDCCGKEIQKENENKEEIKITPDKFGFHPTLKIKLETFIDIISVRFSKEKHVCKYCFIDAIKKLDDRTLIAVLDNQ